jgi:hypothetical protein
MRIALTFFLLSIFKLNVSAQTEIIQLKDSVQLEMIFVKGGAFIMGSGEGKTRDQLTKSISTIFT